MNAHERDLTGLAQLHYTDGEYVVLKPGRFVLCARTGVQIPLERLRYWSAERQEAYANATEASRAFTGRP